MTADTILRERFARACNEAAQREFERLWQGR
jgi:hypothetical protein